MTSAKIKGRKKREMGKTGNKDVKEMVRDIIYYTRNTNFFIKNECWTLSNILFIQFMIFQSSFTIDLLTQTNINTCINIKKLLEKVILYKSYHSYIDK